MGTRASVAELVRNDHKRIREMFMNVLQIPKGDAKKRKPAYAELRRELSRHSLIEEEMLYSVIKKNPAAQTFLRISTVQHGIIDKLVSRMDCTPMGDALWEKTLRELHETVVTHMRHEEEEMALFLPPKMMKDIPPYLRTA